MSGATDLTTLSTNSTTLATQAALQTTAQQTQATQTALQTAAQQSIAQRLMGGVPTTATPFSSSNTTLVTSTAVQVVRAAVTSKKKWITWISVSNPTAAETPIITVQDDTGTPVVIDTFAPGAVGSLRRTYEPPIEVAAGKQIGAKADSSVGDTTVTVGGFEQA